MLFSRNFVKIKPSRKIPQRQFLITCEHWLEEFREAFNDPRITSTTVPVRDILMSKKLLQYPVRVTNLHVIFSCKYKMKHNETAHEILAGLHIRVRIGKLFPLFLIRNIRCGSQWDGSLSTQITCLNWLITIIRSSNFFIWIYVLVLSQRTF